jgi:hypothetical protein
MDLETIDIIFTFGKFAALTPSSTNKRNPHCLQKLYEICVSLLYLLDFLAFNYVNYPEFQILTSIQFVLAVFCNLHQFCYVFYILVVMMRLRRGHWFRLIKSLSGIKPAPKQIPLKLVFVASQLVYYCLTAFGVYANIDHASLTVAALNMGAFYQNYAQFFYLVFTSILLMMVLSRYEGLSETLSKLLVIKARGSQLHATQVVEILQKKKDNVFTLKECVENFNDIFGWSHSLHNF